MQTAVEPHQKEFVTVRQFCERYKWPTQSALRAMILDAHTKGLESAFRRIGKRVLIDVGEFWRIIDQLGGAPQVKRGK